MATTTFLCVHETDKIRDDWGVIRWVNKYYVSRGRERGGREIERES